MPRPSAVEVHNARTHNLKGVSCRIPHGKVTVVTGPSGAGKSSLAFDTVYAEGHRRFVESMSTYARNFLEQRERPPVDEIRNVLPAVALVARNPVRNARSTVATLTEIHDVLRLLYAHLGEVGCPHGHGPARRASPPEAAAELAAGAVGEPFLLVVRQPRPPRGAEALLAELVRLGFGRWLDPAGEVRRLAAGDPWPAGIDPLPLVLGRFRATAESAPRVAAALEEGLRIAARVEATGPDGTRFVAAELACPVCGEAVSPPSPALFSFNSPLGACPECQGFGRLLGIDRERVVPDPTRPLSGHPFAPWNSPAYEELYDDLLTAAAARGIDVDRPWGELSPEERAWAWSGKGEFCNLDDFFSWLTQRSYKVHVRVLLARYRSYDPCPRCGGTRLRPEALAVRLGGARLPDLLQLDVAALSRWLAAQRWSEGERARAGHLLAELGERLSVLARVGLEYLELDRQARTLSGGEAQRIRLAAALGSGLTRTLYVLDEPTIGLHPSDSGRLLALLGDLAARGNTVLAVEHDPAIIAGADHVIDLGPRAGEQGGEVVVEGPLATVLAHPESLTAQFLTRRSSPVARSHLARYRRERGRVSRDEELRQLPMVSIRGARANNLRGIDVDFPLGALVAVTGVSGSGKSTLVENVLWANHQRRQGAVEVEPGAVDELRGLERVSDVTLVDQSPLGRSSRSSPVTLTKAYDDIRRLFANTEEARRRRVTPSHFSFNVEGGRCPECLGTGVQEVDMQFMAPVTVICDLCQGRRFRRDVLAISHAGRDIAETLELTVEAALELFAAERSLCRKLQPLVEVGLGYLRLGQPTSTLSGGEAQRLKLASFLSRPARSGPQLFLFDEPTTGLHLSDVDLLVRTLRRLVARGDSVLVVEHHLDLISRVDWVIDLGPGGGPRGGELLFCGPLPGLLEQGTGPTAIALRAELAARAAGRRSDRIPSDSRTPRQQAARRSS